MLSSQRDCQTSHEADLLSSNIQRSTLSLYQLINTEIDEKLEQILEVLYIYRVYVLWIDMRALIFESLMRRTHSNTKINQMEFAKLIFSIESSLVQ